jgi:hypothetical protein
MAIIWPRNSSLKPLDIPTTFLTLREIMLLVVQVWVQGDRRQQLEQIAIDIDDRSTFPQLYIYSLADVVIPYKAVEGMMEVCSLNLEGPSS